MAGCLGYSVSVMAEKEFENRPSNLKWKLIVACFLTLSLVQEMAQALDEQT